MTCSQPRCSETDSHDRGQVTADVVGGAAATREPCPRLASPRLHPGSVQTSAQGGFSYQPVLPADLREGGRYLVRHNTRTAKC